MSTAAAPDTWMPFWIGPYLANTLHLTRAQHGSYILLILAAWKAGGVLPDDDATLSTIARCSAKEWRTERAIYAAFFVIDGGTWLHDRVVLELEKAAGFQAKQRANGLQGGRPPKPKQNPTETQSQSQTKAKANPTETTLPTPLPKPSHGKTIGDPPSAPAPDGARSGASNETWRQRLEAYDPHKPRETWQPFWGPRPDAPGHQPLIPADLLRWYRARAAQARAGAQ